jgi:hypothetical protein
LGVDDIHFRMLWLGGAYEKKIAQQRSKTGPQRARVPSFTYLTALAGVIA